jgi:hypothetical protein
MKAILLLAFFLVLGCGADTLPKFSKLEGLRILGLRAEDPETLPAGGAITVKALLYDRDGRTLNYVASICTDPGIARGATPSCTGVSDASQIASSSANPGANRLVEITLNVPNTPATVLSGASTAEAFNGVGYLLVLRVTSADGAATQSAFKQLVVSDATKTTKNQNPNFNATGILSNGSAITAMPTAEISVTPSLVAGAEESYLYKVDSSLTIPLTESITVTWLASDGEYSRTRTTGVSSSNTFTPPTSAVSGYTPVLVAIARDPRGGVTWTSVDLP